MGPHGPHPDLHHMQLGLELPSRSLGIAHTTLAAGLATLALLSPRPSAQRLVFGLALAVIILLPILWVGPLWSETSQSFKTGLGFYVTFLLSLGIPSGAAASSVVILARRAPPPRVAIRLALPLVAYLLGLLASYPFSFNYALLYRLIR